MSIELRTTRKYLYNQVNMHALLYEPVGFACKTTLVIKLSIERIQLTTNLLSCD